MMAIRPREMGAMRTATRSRLFYVQAVPLLLAGAVASLSGACESSSTPSDSGPSEAGASGAPNTGGEAGGGAGGGAHSGGGSSGGASAGAGGKNTAGAGGEAAVCGNGRTEDDEECDDGEESSECNEDCTLAECGDGTKNVAAGEACDDGGESAECTADCTGAECGDEKVNATAGEECDGEFKVYENNQWWVVTTNYCLECKLNVCGDGILLDHGPACDAGEFPECATLSESCDPNTGTTDDAQRAQADSPTCDVDCTTAGCGDGHRNAERGEECDDGNRILGDGCDANCWLE
jgi:cysteine-rich repeat protein